jgi:hypothetical protein
MIDGRRTAAEDVIAAGDRWLAEIGPAIAAADPEGLVSPSSRLLCAGLGLLGVEAHRALGGSSKIHEVGRAGAMLSLLTKVDDQVIDAPAFHGAADRTALPDRTRAFLAPTLASIRDARPATTEPRCALAADLGARLRALAADQGRLDRVLATIAHGWEVQVEAVRVLTSHPSRVTRDEIAAVTRSISGVWLLMIARLGELPSDARRPFTAEEEAAFLDWGWAIQRADAIADFEKDLADGHLASWPARLLFERAGGPFLDAVERADTSALYALLRAHDVDLACMPDAAEERALSRSLPDLGEVRSLLAFIHDYLVRRHLAHPACLHRDRAPAPRPSARLFPRAEASCSAP